MSESKHVRYVGPYDEAVAYPPQSGGQVNAKKGERVEVTPDQHKELTGASGGGNWEDATTTARKSD